MRLYQRIWIVTKTPAELSVVLNCSRFHLRVYILSAYPFTAVCPGGVDNSWQGVGTSSRHHTRRKNLEQFKTTESWAWASCINSYSLGCVLYMLPQTSVESGLWIRQLVFICVHNLLWYGMTPPTHGMWPGSSDCFACCRLVNESRASKNRSCSYSMGDPQRQLRSLFFRIQYYEEEFV